MPADIAALARKYAAPHGGVSSPEPKIHVDEVASQVAALYEKVRHIVDYREEHLLRKHFIGRTYTRNVMLHGESKVAAPLMKDLIRAGHLPNDAIPERKIADVQALIDRVRALRAALPTDISPERKRSLEERLCADAALPGVADFFVPLPSLSLF